MEGTSLLGHRTIVCLPLENKVYSNTLPVAPVYRLCSIIKWAGSLIFRELWLGLRALLMMGVVSVHLLIKVPEAWLKMLDQWTCHKFRHISQ